MLIGEYQHTIDIKKRLAVPAKFRKDLGEKAVITKGLENCLVIYTLDEWGKLAQKLANLPTAQADARNFARVMLSQASDVELDKLGRILIPDSLKNYAVLKKNVTLLGLSTKIEIWDSEKWAEHKQRTESSVGDIAERLKEMGI
ncbi:MAG: cell division/cell wall cluster transcriptional repressor MraZ [Candidatus Nealsonbacteria bacterium RIFCSPLOWO2_01_FULL_43_32]|uniref:Transcriptional regulator MraZ n=1 Tax=Candidatus Nealsonbacteria bacterium RIFCSPLOWO2_01_FULL_43_32 TaxID=1801672 RepID=A0A1G2EFZ7_9BACT|nr:MAG: cell division/cell wall cluster transcriptional repressor MraZ [Candidatus Nealsonbacteria bacterium RIFCSPLOWO2_01_FULL_43_32]